MSQATAKGDVSSSGWSEIQALLQQTQQENSSMRLQLELLKGENRQLKDRLRMGDIDPQDVRTDTEKARLLGLEGSSTDEENTPAENNELDEDQEIPIESDEGVGTSCHVNDSGREDPILSLLPSSSEGSLRGFLEESSLPADANWEGHSSEGEGSVACLQDRIQQMEENHYSVNEELQATLQELSDLQQSVSDLTFGNEKLSEDKGLIIDAIARQITNLNRLKDLAEFFKALLDSNEIEYSLDEFLDVSLVRADFSAEHADLEDITKNEKARQELCAILKDHNSILESEEQRVKMKLGEMERMMHQAVKEKQELEQKLTVITGQLASSEVEREKHQELLSQERQKLVAVFQNQDPEGNLNLDLLITNARKEKDGLESRCRELEEALNDSNNHAEKLQVELEKVEYQFDLNKQRFDEEAASYQEIIRELEEEKEEVENDYMRMKDAVIELEDAYERLDSDRQQHLSTINDLNEAVQSLRKEKQSMQRDLLDLKRNSVKDTEEWVQFQKDLQQTVRIANDYREEAQDEVKKLEKEKVDLQNKVKSLSTELDRLSKSDKGRTSIDTVPRSPLVEKDPEIQKRAHAFLKSAEKEKSRATSTTTSTPRKSSSFNNNSNTQLSVRNLINSIEKDAQGDTPKTPTSPTFPSPTRTSMDRRNSFGSSSKRPESKLRRSATVPIPPPTDRIISTSTKSLDDASTLKDARRSLGSRSSDLRTPTTRGEARQNISNVLYRRSDAGSRKSSLTGSRDSTGSLSSIKVTKQDTVSLSSARDAMDAKKDPLSKLVKVGGGGSKRNALLKWCQYKTQGYKGIDVTNFSSSWNDGLAFCAILHSYIPTKIPFHELNNQDKRRNFTLAFKAGESVGIPSILEIEDMVKLERPHWQSVLSYVTSIYTHFEAA